MKKLHCAIYTRKSSEEGLEQEFNSLQAQREACEAFVRSQAGEGWTVLNDTFDDGGYSGGSMDRPALKRLLIAVEQGAINVVVVYKVDRLTRSLTDFSRIIEVLDRAGASFVSVTQAFNTTTSMGRLTLNVLLSFAQFEREVTGERIRDKIAASKAKGMWMGGMVPLGYDLADRRLVVNAAEAELINLIYCRYLELGSVGKLCAELRTSDIKSKVWTTNSGRQVGGRLLDRGALFHILRNRIYVGEIEHKGQAFPGRHQAIVRRELFEEVQAKLKQQARARRTSLSRTPLSPLTGRLFNEAGEAMSPSFAYGRRGRRYRYYVAMTLQKGLPRSGQSNVTQRLSASAVERFLTQTLVRLWPEAQVSADRIAASVERVDLRRSQTQLVLITAELFGTAHPELAYRTICGRLLPNELAVWDDESRRALRLCIPVTIALGARRHAIEGTGVQGKTMSDNLGQAMRASHRMLAKLNASPLANLNFERALEPKAGHQRQLAKLAFLAPDIQHRLLTGDHHPKLKLRSLLRAEAPLAWEDQRAWFDQLV